MAAPINFNLDPTHKGTFTRVDEAFAEEVDKATKSRKSEMEIQRKTMDCCMSCFGTGNIGNRNEKTCCDKFKMKFAKFCGSIAYCIGKCTSAFRSSQNRQVAPLEPVALVHAAVDPAPQAQVMII